MTKIPGARNVWFTQYVDNPKTGEHLFDEGQLLKGLAKSVTIEKWAYVLHDKDTYNEDKIDEETGEILQSQGDMKGHHYHVVLQMSKHQPLDKIAEWFDIPVNQIDIIKGGHAGVLDCMEYLTHEHEKQQEKGKYLYSDDEIKVSDSFKNWRELVTERQAQRIRGKAKKRMSDIDKLSLKVMNGELTYRQAKEEEPVLFSRYESRLRKMREVYLSECPPPQMRLNFYICGKGGVGKTVLAESLAYSVSAALGGSFDEHVFIVGGNNVSFEGYDGQEIIIWDDFRPYDLINTFGSRGQFLGFFDMSPSKRKVNVKYGSVNLINAINIVTGALKFDTFLDGLAGEYTDKLGNKYEAEDKGQTYRRFPIIIPVNADDFSILVNAGVLFRNPKRYVEYQEELVVKNVMSQIAGPFKKYIQQDNKEGLKELVGPLVDPIHSVREDLVESHQSGLNDDMDEIIEDIYGEKSGFYIKDMNKRSELVPGKLINPDGSTSDTWVFSDGEERKIMIPIDIDRTVQCSNQPSLF